MVTQQDNQGQQVAAISPKEQGSSPSSLNETVIETGKWLESYPSNYAHSFNLSLVPIDRCYRLLSALDGAIEPCNKRDAVMFATTLVGLYPAREVNNAPVYIAGLQTLFEAYPRRFVRRVVDVVHGLPSKSKWLPTPAEVKEALEAEVLKRNNVVARARWTIAEFRRREDEAKREESYNATPEQKAAAVKAWEDAKLGIKTIPGEPRRLPTPPEHLVIEEEAPL